MKSAVIHRAGDSPHPTTTTTAGGGKARTDLERRAAGGDAVLPPHATTFTVVDFFDYESQTTHLLPGSNPRWDHAASFKIHVDDFLLGYLASDALTLEVSLPSPI